MPKKIGVISNAGSRVSLTDQAIKCLVNEGAEYLILSGIVNSYKNLEIIKNTKLPYVIVLDKDEYRLHTQYKDNFHLQIEPYTIRIEEILIKIMGRPISTGATTDIIISSYSNIFDIFIRNNSLYINTSSVNLSNENNTSCLLIDLESDKYTINNYSRGVNSKFWKKEKKILNINQILL